MSHPTNTSKLRTLETQLRHPDNDKQYLRQQLLYLAAVLYAETEDNVEDGLTAATIGGLSYVLQRLRSHLDTKFPVVHGTDALAEIYAGVELNRFCRTDLEGKKAIEHFRTENLLVNVHTIQDENEHPVRVFTSKVDQTTIGGRKILKGELIDPPHAPVASFPEVYKNLPDNKKVLKSS